jgi:hypothetical protein
MYETEPPSVPLALGDPQLLALSMVAAAARMFPVSEQVGGSCGGNLFRGTVLSRAWYHRFLHTDHEIYATVCL